MTHSNSPGQMTLTCSIISVNQPFPSISSFSLYYFLAVWTLEEPLIFLYDSLQRKYGVYPLSPIMNQNIDIESILDDIISNYSEIIQHTGNTWKKRVFRPFWEFYRTFLAMFIEAPLLSMLIIGLPSAILSIVCYCLCCLSNEASIEDREILYERMEEEDGEQKPTIEKKEN
jgi:hypothetical protein